jgi:hypothetical protein
MLTSFKVAGFRAFSDTSITRLGQVNLIVGKNNVGKTSLLEAIRLYIMGGSRDAIRRILVDHDEVSLDSEAADEAIQISSLFHGRGTTDDQDVGIAIGPLAGPHLQLAISPVLLRWVEDNTSEPVRRRRLEVYDEESDSSADTAEDLEPGLTIHRGSAFHLLPLSAITRRAIGRKDTSPPTIAAAGTDQTEVARWWDVIGIRRESEKRVLQCLNLVLPIERITLVDQPYRNRSRMFMVRLEGEDSPIPLRALGDGMARMFQIAVALENARASFQSQSGVLFPELQTDDWMTNPVLLIDEVENGIHYSVLPRLWNFIMKTARLHNIQVFATTHSWDCVEGFQLAANENTDVDGVLIRLEQRGKQIEAITVDEGELAIVTRDRIEVR